MERRRNQEKRKTFGPTCRRKDRPQRPWVGGIKRHGGKSRESGEGESAGRLKEGGLNLGEPLPNPKGKARRVGVVRPGRREKIRGGRGESNQQVDKKRHHLL